MKKKTVALLLALVLVVGVAAGGTMAWLLDTTDTITNTFTAGDVDIELTETGVENDGTTKSNSYKMVPGYTITKDPTVTVKANSEKCYVFVKLEKSDNFDTFMSYTIAEGWMAGDGGKASAEGGTANDVPEGVYYRVVNSSNSAQDFKVLANDTVSVNSTVTKEQMTTANTTNPTLKVTAYACQYYKSNTATNDDTNGTPFSLKDAWETVSKPANSDAAD